MCVREERNGCETQTNGNQQRTIRRCHDGEIEDEEDIHVETDSANSE